MISEKKMLCIYIQKTHTNGLLLFTP